jgi:integrase/recombinase XerC
LVSVAALSKSYEFLVAYLRREKLWGHDDPLFPKTLTTIGAAGQFEHVQLSREHWANATPIRDIFRQAFEAAGLPYYHPHSLRHTLAQMGERLCQTPEQFKAWSQNLGHEGVLTTLFAYGTVPEGRQREIMTDFGIAADGQRMTGQSPAGKSYPFV